MSGSRRQLLRVLAVAAVLAVLLTAIASACPLCKEETPDNGPGMWRGMYWSILLMVGMPFTAAGTLVFLVFRARRRHAASLPPAPAPLSFPESRGARS
jgi:hypothetical protein